MPRPEPEATAFLQLTSGSTGVSRAVSISHRAAIHNNMASDEAIGAPHGEPAHAWADAMVSWLPLHHDMGLPRSTCTLKRDPVFLTRRNGPLWQGMPMRRAVPADAPNCTGYICCECVFRQWQRAGQKLTGNRSGCRDPEQQLTKGITR